MGEPYKIIRRKDGRDPDTEYMIDFDKHNYSVPLAGCNDSPTIMPRVGDVIGVIFQSTVPYKKVFEASCSLIPDEVLSTFHREGSYYPKEEHFFRVSKIIGNSSRMDVEKVFLDGYKIIRKLVQESFTHNETMEVKVLKKYRLIEQLLEKDGYSMINLGNIVIEKNLNYFSTVKAKKFVELFSHSEENWKNTEKEKLLKMLPYEDYEYLSIDLENENTRQKLVDFLNEIAKHKSYFIETLGEEVVNKLGTVELIEKKMEEHYQQLIAKLGETIEVNVEYYLYVSPHIDEADIMQNLKKLKQSQIYRIYDVDRKYCLVPTKTISDWSGGILDDSIRSKIKEGCTVRVYFSTYEKNQHGNYGERVIYFKLLHPTGKPGRFLAQLLNMYMSEYEDIVVEIDVAAVSEIPLSWDGNECLEKIVEEESLRKPEGYSMTGLGAANVSKDEATRETISLYYDIYNLFSY